MGGQPSIGTTSNSYLFYIYLTVDNQAFFFFLMGGGRVEKLSELKCKRSVTYSRFSSDACKIKNWKGQIIPQFIMQFCLITKALCTIRGVSLLHFSKDTCVCVYMYICTHTLYLCCCQSLHRANDYVNHRIVRTYPTCHSITRYIYIYNY